MCRYLITGTQTHCAIALVNERIARTNRYVEQRAGKGIDKTTPTINRKSAMNAGIQLKVSKRFDLQMKTCCGCNP